MSTKQPLTQVFWHEHCIILTNINKSVELPEGSGLEVSQDERFHLSLLNKRIWGRDNFWYLAFLPKFPSLARDPLFKPLGTPFDHLPIMLRQDGLYAMKPSILDQWLQLEFYLVATYNLLKEKFLPLAPLQTILPPYPQSTNFHHTHETDEAARRATHRARRLFLGWLCLVAATIAASAKLDERSPPAWYRIIAQAEPPFPPFWLDQIASSPILTDFSATCPRRGLVVNMCTEWAFLVMEDLFTVPYLPVWLCFPHGVGINHRLAKQLMPTQSLIDNAKHKHYHDVVEIDAIQYSPLPPSPGPVLPYRRRHAPSPVTAMEESPGDSDPRGADGTASPLAEVMHDPQTPSADLPSDEHLDALTYFFRRRKHLNDLRANDHSSQRTIRGLSLFQGSRVYKWETLEFFPWFERTEVPECERWEVWSSHTPAQRVYNEFEDTWDCAEDFAPLQDVNCNRPGCREPFHDHLEEGVPAIENVGLRLPTHLRDPTTYHQSLAAEGGECLALSFSRYQMDDFLDVLKYRYGIKLPDRISPPDPRVQSSTLSQGLLEALRGMVQEEAAKESQWKDPRLMTILEEFFSCIKAHKSVPLHISDCHLSNEAFERLSNPWSITITKQASLGSGASKWILKTLDSRIKGWYIRVNGRTTLREVLRRRLGPGNCQITTGLVERGIPFSILWVTSSWMLRPFSHLVNPLYRPDSYNFTPADYRAYVERRLHLFRDRSVAIAALQEGGIIWRLAVESNIDIYSISESIGNNFATNECPFEGGSLFESVLTPEVINTIVGVYKVYTGKGEQTSDVSWWPKDNTWQASGFNCGHWTLQCEGWFCRRLDAIHSGTGIPRKTRDWQSALRLRFSTTRKLMQGMENTLHEDEIPS